MKNTFILFLVALSFVCSSCNRTPSVEEPDVLKVELKETPVSCLLYTSPSPRDTR